MRSFLLNFWKYIALAFGIAIFIVLVTRVGTHAILEYFKEIGPKFFLMPAIAILGLCIRGIAILPLLPTEAHLGWLGAILSRLAATALNIAVPVFGVGGEAARLLWISREHQDKAIAAIILDRTLLIVADLAFLFIAIIAALAQLTLPPHLEWYAITAAFGAILAAAALWWLLSKGVSVPFVKGLKAVGFKSIGEKVPNAEAIDEFIRYTWQKRFGHVAIAFIIQFISRIFLAGEVWLGLWLLSVPASPLKAFLVAATPIGINAIFTFVPSQLGVQEAGIGLVFGVLRLGIGTGVVLGVIQRISQLFQIPVGFAALAAAPKRRA